MDIEIARSFAIDDAALTDEQNRQLWRLISERAEQELDNLMAECLSRPVANSLQIVNTGRRDARNVPIMEFREIDAEGGPASISYVDESKPQRPKSVPRWYDWSAP